MVQGREGSEVPMDVVTAVRSELAKERLSRNNINPKIIRAALKRLGQSKFFDSSPSICHQLGGPKPPVIGSEAESQLKSMFSAIQKPFATHCPPSRRNFLSYSFVLHKFAQLIERDDLLGAFPLLKSSTKLYVQDQIWRKICSDLDWAFYPSV